MNFKSILASAKLRLLHLIGRTPKQIWNRKLDKLVMSVDPKWRTQSRVLIDNFHHSAAIGHGDIKPRGGDLDASLITIQLAALRRMRSMNLVGFQPMSGPVCHVFSLQWKEDELDPTRKLLAVEKGVAEAKRNPLEIKWPIEAIHDMQTLNGADVLPEIEAATADELALECDGFVMHGIKSVSTKLISKTVDDWQTLTVILHRMANGIAQRSRRGCGNWAIIPLWLIPMLQENPNYLHFPEEGGYGLRLMGELLAAPDAKHGIRIYTDATQEDNTILVGYKGQHEIDTGYIYSPYIMAVPTGITTDPNTFQPMQRFYNRGGVYTHSPENYYTSMEVIA